MSDSAAGTLAKIRVLEMAGRGPGPFAAMMLADMGADVIRIDRPPRSGGDDFDTAVGSVDPRAAVVNRGRRSIVVDVKTDAGRDLLLQAAESADVLIEGYRPGVMERLGLGPEVALRRNPRLIYGRMTGWGQEGPMARRAGHDITYIAMAGALRMFARAGERPVPPRNYVGDIGGGGLMLAFGIVCALLERAGSNVGQVVDAAMVDGIAALGATQYGMIAQGRWTEPPGTNYSDTGAPFYEVYETSDGGYMAVGALESGFYEQLVAGLGLTGLPPRDKPENWPAMKARFADAFRTKTQGEWTAIFAGTDACVAPVLGFAEAARDPHLASRGTFVVRDGVLQAAPAPRLSRTPGRLPGAPPKPGQDTDQVLRDLGMGADRIERLRAAGIVV